MKKAMNVFLRDMRNLSKNVVALIIVIGISVLPCCYAWFNIAASWDPYGSTKNVKIAVASNDEGYQGSLIPLKINIGDTVISKLSTNDKLGWQFVTEEEARKGVEDGSYYAAIIIPSDFSKKMLSVFTENIENPTLGYYYNAKINAISPKITDKGSKTIKSTVNTSFNETLLDAIMTVAKTIGSETTEEKLTQAAQKLLDHVRSSSSDLTRLNTTLDSFDQLNQSVRTLLSTTSAFISEARSAVSSDSSLLDQGSQAISSLQTDLDSTLNGLETALSSTQQTMESMTSQIQSLLDQISSGVSALGDGLGECASVIGSIYDALDVIDQSLTGLKDQYPDYADTIVTLQGIVQSLKLQQGQLRDELNAASQSCKTSPENVRTILQSIVSDLQTVSSDLKQNLEVFRQDIKSRLTDLSAKVAQAENSLSVLIGDLDNSVTSVNNTVSGMSSRLTEVDQALDETKNLVSKAASVISQFQTQLEEALATQDSDAVRKLLSQDVSTISKYLSSPVTLNTIPVYEVTNYGSGMAPFYTALSIWVGGIILAAMLKTRPGRENSKLKAWQFYLGRYMIFLILGLVQTTLICLGDLYFLGIQCQNPLLFMVSGWIASIVYINLIYTLTISFGNVGKALAVILMVMQVAGSGGTFPIETTPEIFQKIYPFLPFEHTMTMMRECIAGFYGNTYWESAGYLGLILLGSLFFGLVLRRPVMLLTDWISRQTEKTNLIE